jgi:hypothetical protein
MVSAPARSTLRNIGFNGDPYVGDNYADAVAIEVNDLPGSRVLLSDLKAEGTSGLVSDGLDQAITEDRSSDINATERAITAIGGISGKSNATRFGRLSVFGGGDATIASDGYSHTVQSGGQLTVQDNWHDGDGSSPNFTNLTDSGTVTFQGGSYCASGPSPFSINGFKGDVSLIGYQTFGNDLTGGNGDITVSGDTSQLRFLAFGVIGYGTSDFLVNTGSGGEVGMLMSRFYFPTMPSSAGVIPDEGFTSPSFVRSMFSHIRHVHTTPPLSIRPGITDARIEHIFVLNQKIAVHLIPADPADKVVQSYTIGSDDGISELASNIDNTLVVAAASATPQDEWALTLMDDGGFQISNISNGLILDSDLSLDTSSGSPGQSWLIEPTGDGYYSIQNSLSGLFLSISGSAQSLALGLLPNVQGDQEWRLQPVY